MNTSKGTVVDFEEFKRARNRSLSPSKTAQLSFPFFIPFFIPFMGWIVISYFYELEVF